MVVYSAPAFGGNKNTGGTVGNNRFNGTNMGDDKRESVMNISKRRKSSWAVNAHVHSDSLYNYSPNQQSARQSNLGGINMGQRNDAYGG